MPDSLRPGPPDERLRRDERLRKRADYQRCYRFGRRRHAAHLVLHFVDNSLGYPRLGITASRKVGKAVTRQRLKRRIREIYRRWARRSRLPARDLVIHLKPGVGALSFEELRQELLGVLGWLLGSQRQRHPHSGDPRAGAGRNRPHDPRDASVRNQP